MTPAERNWTRLRINDTFFVPTLDPKKTRQDYILYANDLRYKLNAQPGIYRGVFGVLFTRLS